MSDQPPPDVPGGPHLRTVAMPGDANPGGVMFGGWTLSQMDLAGATFAAERARGRVATVGIEAMKFLRPIPIGDEVSCYCALDHLGRTSVGVKIETWTRGRAGESAQKVTEGVFTFVALDEAGHPREIAEGSEAQA
jgi:acyl-CoA thioesterase YciA